MSSDRVYTYECMFLFPHAVAASLQDAVDHVKELLDRAGAEIISFRKWDERRLAFEIKGHKRGVYFLAYFKAPAENMVKLERDCNLSEKILRAMPTRADHLTEETIAAADGREALADEIKVRAAGATAEAAGATTSVVTKPAEKATEAPSE